MISESNIEDQVDRALDYGEMFWSKFYLLFVSKMNCEWVHWTLESLHSSRLSTENDCSQIKCLYLHYLFT